MRLNNRYRTKIAGFCFILPALLVVGLLLLYPVVSSIFYSFTSKHLIKPGYDFVFFDNYIKILTDKDFWMSFLTSVRWTIVSLIGQIVVGFTAALALERIRHGRGIYRTLLIIPWAFPSIVIALSWKWILNGVSGFLPNFLVKIGLCQSAPQFFSSGGLVFPTLVFINIWFGAPLIMVNVLSALQTVPKDQYEAAQLDGASPWQSFVHITLPHIPGSGRPAGGAAHDLGLQQLRHDLPHTGGGPANLTQTVPIYAYNVGWGLKQLGRSSAVTVLLLIFLLIVCMFYFKILDKWEKEGA